MGRKIIMEKITYNMKEYPQLLREIKNPPDEIYFKGDISLLNKRCAAIVGSRKSTPYGRNTAREISSGLAGFGTVIVSGLAKGIDTCAHEGALSCGGKTVAVLGSGVDICYPAGNEKLKKRIEDEGLIISEYPPGTLPKKYHFPQRNRIISGISEVLFVIQAGNGSGALITADLAAEQGRDVCAIPGNIDSIYNLGSNKLIKEGAIPIITPADAYEIMGFGRIDSEEKAIKVSGTEKKLYDLLAEHGEMSIDDICVFMKKTPAQVSSIIAVMELKGFVFSSLGKIFIAKY